MVVYSSKEIYDYSLWDIDKLGLEAVPFNMELLSSEDYIYFQMCFGKIKIPLTLMFWQNLDRLRHRMEETAYVGAWEWVCIPFSDGDGDPLNYVSMMFFKPGKVAVFMDMDNSNEKQLFVCNEIDVIEKMYTSLLKWTSLYDDEIAGTKYNEYFYSKQQAHEHMKSPILEEYIRDINSGNSTWRHYASEPEKRHEYDDDETDTQ